MKQKVSQLLIGVALVIFGGALLLERMHVLHYNSGLVWSAILVVGGVVLAGTGLSLRRNGRTLIGSWGFLYGMFLLLHTMNMLAPFPHLHALAALTAAALSFLLLWLLEPRNAGNVIMSLCFGGFALWVYFAATNEAWAHDLSYIFRTYWPVALILFGLNALMRGMWKRGEHTG